MTLAKAADLRKRVRYGEYLTSAAHAFAEAEATEAPVDIPTLGEIIAHYQVLMSPCRKTWQKSKTGQPNDAQHQTNAVLGKLLSVCNTRQTADGLSHGMEQYAPKSGKAKANGQVSSARAYWMAVLALGAGRNGFKQVGSP